MTALAGLWRFDGRPTSTDSCARMLSAQELYGPHASARWSNGDVAIGRQLMRILPEDRFDHQPVVGHAGRYVLVADIRMDNRDELIDLLGIEKTQARTLCDADILLAAIERWDESCLQHIIGDFAFAFWDSTRRRLVLARDPLGQRPLHYHNGNGFFAFASMPKGLHALAEVPYAPDEVCVAEFLALMPEVGSQSFFQGVSRVEPGHVITVSTTGRTSRQYWNPTRRHINMARPDDYCEALRELLDQAVRCRLRGAQDVGCHLSGGLDSGAVAATAARLLAPSGRRVVAFTAVPRDGYNATSPRNRFVDEGPHAAAAAALYPNIEHVLIRTGGRSPLDDLDRNFFLLDRPVLNICNIGWSNKINDAARERKLTVLLGGNAGNLGLSYHGLELLPELLRDGRWLRWWQEARALVGPQRMRWRGALVQSFGPWCPAALWVWLNKIAKRDILDITRYTGLHPRRLAELDILARAKASGTDIVYRPWKDGFAMRLWALQSVDFGNYQKGILGGWQIDFRDPTADVRLLEFCLAVPTEQYLRKGVPRSLARRALADRMPKLVLDETRKGLQAADWHESLTAVRDDVLAEFDRLNACPSAVKALDLPRLRRLVDHWPSSGWDQADVMIPYRLALLRSISVGHFLRRASGHN
jgi:asparagine synthase (glutamine-hydrolysing)